MCELVSDEKVYCAARDLKLQNVWEKVSVVQVVLSAEIYEQLHTSAAAELEQIYIHWNCLNLSVGSWKL